MPQKALLDRLAVAGHRNGRICADQVLDGIAFTTLLDVLPSTKGPAIVSTDDRAACSHERLRKFVTEDVKFARFGLGRGDRIAVLMPNGPELAVAFVAVLTYFTCAPLNPSNTPAEIKDEIRSVKAKAILIMSGEPNQHFFEIAEDLDLVVMVATPSNVECGIFTLTDGLTGKEPTNSSQDVPLERGDVAMVLHTSGSTGTKKVVPHTLEDLIAGALCITATYQLQPTDICLNQMPLFHIGGIVRNVLSPIISGGSVVAMPYFEPSLFWTVCNDKKCTWYYAGPTMHMLILDAFKALPLPPKIHLRFISNAAGPLLPSVAADMRDTYSNMTECMPISSPPVGYNLDRPGTSGQDDYGNELPRGEHHVGHIMVQGHPVMRAYENNSEATVASFVNGWFKTGDLGYMDEDDFLYITGRSKEVINRGGEIISPTEIEDVLIDHPSIQNLVAFATPHDILQETVGVCVVCKPGMPRVGLPSLQAHAARSLNPSKWPNIVVYAEDIPKTSTGKAMRVRLDQRMNLPSISDSSPIWDRMFEADMLPAGAPAQAAIPTTRVHVDLSQVESAMVSMKGVVAISEAHVCMREHEGKQVVVAYVVPETLDGDALITALQPILAEYLIPSVFMPMACLPRTPNGEVDEEKLPTPMASNKYIPPSSSTQEAIQKIWADVLGLDSSRLPSMDDDFFFLGGSSLLASTVAAKIKKQFEVNISGTNLFKVRTIPAISELIDDLLAAKEAKAALSFRQNSMNQISFKVPHTTFDEAAIARISAQQAQTDAPAPQGMRALSSTRPLALVVQLLPVLFLHPLRRVSSWALFVVVWLWLLRRHSQGGCEIARFPSLIIALLIVRTAIYIVSPLVAIVLKWLIIGRYKEGRYPLWGCYYLRWWLVHQIVHYLGRGLFDASDSLRCHFYRLMGASIGVNCSIPKDCQVTEPDLVFLGDSVALDSKVTVSPFCVDGGEVLLSAIDIGNECCVGAKSTLAPGAKLTDGTCLPPLSSSHEKSDALPEYRKLCRTATGSPPLWMKVLFGLPIMIAIQAIKMGPLVGLIFLMVSGRSINPDTWLKAVDWFTEPRRLGYYVAIRIARAIVCPFVELLCVVIVKRLVIGRFIPGPCSSVWYRFRYWLMSCICSPDLCGVAPLIGNHWGGVSFCMRLLGSTCGKRIFWPGSGLDIVEYDLLTVGDDVVFGSRSTFICNDGLTARPITLVAGSNVADRCVLCPGVILGVNACLGSGSLAGPDTSYMKGAVTVGAAGGNAVILEEGGPGLGDPSIENTVKPFGRTFYGTRNMSKISTERIANTATWTVPPISLYAAYVLFCHAAVAAYHAMQLPCSIFLVDLWHGGRTYEVNGLLPRFRTSPLYNFHEFLLLLYATNCTVHFLAFCLSITLDVTNKWLMIGRRRPGSYSWDTNTYLMWWNMYLSAAVIRKKEVDYLWGTPYLVWYFRAHGCSIGKNVCLFPTGSDPMMTEPELVTIGDGACINSAFIICHTNSKGAFMLNKIVIGANTTMRNFSRSMAGSVVEEGARLLEHTLALVGDVVEMQTIWQGWPVRKMVRNDEYWGARRSRLWSGRKRGGALKNKQFEILHDMSMDASNVSRSVHNKLMRLEKAWKKKSEEEEGLVQESESRHREQLTLIEKHIMLTEVLHKKMDLLLSAQQIQLTGI